MIARAAAAPTITLPRPMHPSSVEIRMTRFSTPSPGTGGVAFLRSAAAVKCEKGVVTHHDRSDAPSEPVDGVRMGMTSTDVMSTSRLFLSAGKVQPKCSEVRRTARDYLTISNVGHLGDRNIASLRALNLYAD